MWFVIRPRDLFGTIVLGNSLDTIRDGMLGELTREDQTNGSLDLFAGDGGALVVSGNLAGLSGNTLEDVIDKAVHDGHCLLGDVDLRVALTEDLEDVARVALVAGAATLASTRGGLLRGLLGGGLAGGLLLSFGGHWMD